MIEKYNEFLLLCGVAFLLSALVPAIAKKLPISLPMLLVVLGITMGYSWDSLPFLDPISNGNVVEKVTEFVVLISLVGAGIKIDTPLSWRYWTPTARLLLITMPLCILAMAMLGYYIFSLSLASAVLLGAVLAPTDPVLASSIQVGAPNTGKEDPSRFTLTSEAGLNDGLAFPFVYLAIKIAEATSSGNGVNSELLWAWFSHDVLWKIGAGTVVGVMVGKLVGRLVFSDTIAKHNVPSGYAVVALTLLAYGLAEYIEGYGFIAVFLAAFFFRNSKYNHHYHKALHEFAEDSEGLLMSLILVTFGMVVGQSLEAGLELTWQVYAICLAFIVLVRPIAGVIGLLGSDVARNDRIIISSLGVRGIGTFYYLAYALNKDYFDHTEALSLWIICAIVILMSIFIHGSSAPMILKAFDRERQ